MIRPAVAVALTAALLGLVGCGGGDREATAAATWPSDALPDVPPPPGWVLEQQPRVLRIAGGSIRRCEAVLERASTSDGDLKPWRAQLARLGWVEAGSDRWRKGDECLTLRKRGAGLSLTLGGL